MSTDAAILERLDVLISLAREGRFPPRLGLPPAPRRRVDDPAYNVWRKMIHRCTNPRAGNWRWYGGRGITVCDRWRHSFALFRADMGPRPSPEHSIDRIDNYRGYEPGNCRWATRAEQHANRRCPRCDQCRSS